MVLAALSTTLEEPIEPPILIDNNNNNNIHFKNNIHFHNFFTENQHAIKCFCRFLTGRAVKIAEFAIQLEFLLMTRANHATHLEKREQLICGG